MKRILVTGAGGGAAIGFCRSLRKAPEEVWILGVDCDPLTLHFAEADRLFVVPRADSPDYLDILNRLVRRFDIGLIHPQPDVEVKKISEGRSALKTRVFLPKPGTIALAQDKFASHLAWKKNGLPVPHTRLLRSPDDLEEALAALGEKVWLRAVRGAGGKGSLLVAGIETARAWVDYWNGWGGFTASEYLPGANIGFDGVWKDGQLVRGHVKERISYALAGSVPSGISGTAGTIRSLDRPDVEETARAAVRVLDPGAEGIFAVDFKENAEGTACLTEVNAGRFLTSSLHFFAEVPFPLPYLYVKLAFGERDDVDFPPTEGIHLIRALDCRPRVLTEEEVRMLKKKKEENPFFEVEPSGGRT